MTHEKLVVRDRAEEVQIPGRDGYLGVLPGHAPLISELGSGEISYRSGGQLHRFSMAWGFAEVLPEKVTILAETCERNRCAAGATIAGESGRVFILRADGRRFLDGNGQDPACSSPP